ncbi:MAG: hypothetical protein K2K40_04010 [Paramuribaculum sp.]|nr:hypothetical protein [Paramuribaculum sp.]
MNILDSIEFYVIAAVAASAVVGLCVRPSSKGEAVTRLLAGELSAATPAPEEPLSTPKGAEATPAIELLVEPDGSVTLTRLGLDGMVHASGALSLVVNVAGFDISIEERLTPGRPVADTPEPMSARFTLDFLGAERYHLRYYSEATGGLAVTPLHVRPGIHIVKPLI